MRRPLRTKVSNRMSNALNKQSITQNRVWRSLFRQGYPHDEETQSRIMADNLFLHLHPVKVKKHSLKITYTWGLGFISFFLFHPLSFAVLVIANEIEFFFFFIKPHFLCRQKFLIPRSIASGTDQSVLYPFIDYCFRKVYHHKDIRIFSVVYEVSEE